MKRNVLTIMMMTMALVSCQQKDQTPTGPSVVRLYSVQTATEAKHVSYPGRTCASKVSNLAFRVSGNLGSVNVREGDAVKEGQIVATMDDRDYRVQLAAVEAEYQQTKADCERVIGLYEDGSTTAQNYDKARYGLEQITAKYNHAQDQLRDCIIRAPFDGYIQDVMRESHETVSAGMPIVSLFSKDGIEVEISLPAAEYLRKDSFGAFSASFDVMPGVNFPLRVLNVAQRANANQLYEVRLLLDRHAVSEQQYRKITPGMATIVNIEYKKDGYMPVVVPSGAVFHKGDSSYVYVYNGQGETGTIKETPVVVESLRLDGMMRIKEGLESGQQVIECGVHRLTDGQLVKPVAPTSKSNVGGLL